MNRAAQGSCVRSRASPSSDWPQESEIFAFVSPELASEKARQRLVCGWSVPESTGLAWLDPWRSRSHKNVVTVVMEPHVDEKVAEKAISGRPIADADIVHDRDYAVLKVGQDRNLFAQIMRPRDSPLALSPSPPSLHFSDLVSTVRISARDHHVKVAELIGQPFGAYFEFSRGKFTRIDKKPDPSLLAPSADGETKDNRNVVDMSENQNLTADEIAKLKADGHSGESIVRALVSSLESFESKTDYAKEKYIKKKQQKYITVVHVVRPTALGLCEAYFDKSPQKIFYLRPDTLSQLLTASNVRAGCSAMVYEECSGLITGSVVEKLGGVGSVLSVHAHDESSIGIQQFFNFKNNESSVLTHLPISKLKKILAGVDTTVDADDLDEITDSEKRARIAEKRAIREQKRKEMEENVRRHCDEGVDSLIIAAREDPLAVLEALFPSLALSGSLVLYSAYKEPLALCMHHLRTEAAAVQLQLSETWMREYQVLPQRTHPLMTMSGTGGYLLTGYKVRSIFGKGALAAFEVSSRNQDEAQGEEGEDEPKRKKQRTRR